MAFRISLTPYSAYSPIKLHIRETGLCRISDGWSESCSIDEGFEKVLSKAALFAQASGWLEKVSAADVAS